MLRIRLQRTGRRNLPAFRIVVAEKARSAKGKFVEILGHYLPSRKPHVLEYKKERVGHWIQHGAMPSNTVARLLKREGCAGMEKFIDAYTKKKKRKIVEEKKPEAAPTAKTEITEKPTEEAGAGEGTKEVKVEKKPEEEKPEEKKEEEVKPEKEERPEESKEDAKPEAAAEPKAETGEPAKVDDKEEEKS